MWQSYSLVDIAGGWLASDVPWQAGIRALPLVDGGDVVVVVAFFTEMTDCLARAHARSLAHTQSLGCDVDELPDKPKYLPFKVKMCVYTSENVCLYK